MGFFASAHSEGRRRLARPAVKKQETGDLIDSPFLVPKTACCLTRMLPTSGGALWTHEVQQADEARTPRSATRSLSERIKNRKTQILDEFIDIAGCHCEHAIRFLKGIDPVMPDAPILGRTIYSAAVREALVVLWALERPIGAACNPRRRLIGIPYATQARAIW